MHVHLHGLINYELIIITISIVCIVYNNYACCNCTAICKFVLRAILVLCVM